MKNNNFWKYLVSFNHQGKPGLQTNIQQGDLLWEFTNKEEVKSGG